MYTLYQPSPQFHHERSNICMDVNTSCYELVMMMMMKLCVGETETVMCAMLTAIHSHMHILLLRLVLGESQSCINQSIHHERKRAFG